MTKKYKIWFWVNVGVLVSIFVFKFLWEIGILSEELFREHFEILAWINIPVFFVMLMLLIYSWRKELKYKWCTTLVISIIVLTSIFGEIHYSLIAAFLIIFPLSFLFRPLSYFSCFPFALFDIILHFLRYPGAKEMIWIAILIAILVPFLEIIRMTYKKDTPKQYAALSTPLNAGIIAFLMGAIISAWNIFSFNSSSIFIAGAIIYAISLLYTFLSLPKSSYIDWPKQWKIRYRNYEIIPGIIFLAIAIISLTMDNFFSILSTDIYTTYELNFNEAIPYLHKPF